jgi:hypothetical protein
VPTLRLPCAAAGNHCGALRNSACMLRTTCSPGRNSSVVADRLLVAGALALSLIGLSARVNAAQTPVYPKLLPANQEIAIALSAGPKVVQAGAGVYVLEARGFVKVRESTNGFTCIINRDRPQNTKPTCYDREGSASIVPVDLAVGALLMRGVPIDQIRRQIRDGFAAGAYHSPRRPGVAYMLSDKNYDYDPSSGRLEHFPPHVMFYAPNLTNADIGSDGGFEPGLPSIGYQGPQGFMIVVMPTPSSDAGSTGHAH